MKTKRILFLTSFLCGIALSFSFSLHGKTSSVPATEPSRTHNLSSSSAVNHGDQTAFNVATRLVSNRDAAVIAHDMNVLSELTVPNSPARAIDEKLFESVGGIAELNTVVLDVRVIKDNEWEVRSIQQEIRMADGRSGAGEERCTVWIMEENPWRLYETRECG